MPDNPAWKNQGTGPAKKDSSALPAWKKEAGGAAEPAKSGVRPWQDQNSAKDLSPKSDPRGTKLLAALGLLGLLVVAVVVVVMWLRPLKPACLVVMGSSYDVNLSLPHNVYGFEGLKGLVEHADKTGYFWSWFATPSKIRLAYPLGEPEEIKGEKSWQTFWDEFPKIQEDTVIVFLALHGGADDKGAYLFLGDPRGRDKKYLGDIIEELPKKWPGKNILLILDPTQIAFHWPSGMLQNHFVRELKKLKPKIEENPKLLVFCSSDEDQISWASEEWRRTIFSHYLIEGLRGAAHEQGSNRIKGKELFKYVRDNVANWSQVNRDAVQTPIVLGRAEHAEDWGLVQTKEIYTEQSPVEAPGNDFIPSGDLKEAWEKCAAFREQVPLPEVYTPQLWRLYRDLLVRWEQLERAGDPTKKVATLKKQVADLNKEIPDAARVELASREMTRALPLPAVLGLSPNKIKDDRLKIWPQIWQTDDKEKRNQSLRGLLKQAKAEEGEGAEIIKNLYGQLSRRLLIFLKDKFLTNATMADIEKGQELLTLLNDNFPLSQRLTEMHYLKILLDNVDRNNLPPGKLLAKVLEVRLLAEEAALAAPATLNARHPYSEVVYGSIKLQIEEADKKRLQGEDWLMGTRNEEWRKSAELLDEASAIYRKSLQNAEILRDALALKDRVLGDLPYYAEWLALRRTPRDEAEAKKMRDGVEQVELLNKSVGTLLGALAKGDIPEVKVWHARVKKDFEDNGSLPEHFKNVIDDLNQGKHLQSDLHEIEAALAVPLVKDPAQRMLLLRNCCTISKKLNEIKEKAGDPMNRQEELTEKIPRQKRLALAALVSQNDKHPLGNAGEVQEGILAENIGKFWQNMPDKIAAGLVDARQNLDLKEAAEQLREAAFLCRLVPGGSFPLWGDYPYGPPQGLRYLRLHDFLLWQAERAKRDYYWDADSDKPFYVRAVQDYARMAQDLAEAGTNDLGQQIKIGRGKESEKIGKDVTTWALKVNPSSRPDWTSELTFPVRWKIEAEPEIPQDVIPMFWLNQEGALKADQRPDRQAVGLMQDITYTLQRPINSKEDNRGQKQTSADFVCLLRGQKIPKSVSLKIWEPDSKMQHFPPQKSGIAFRLDKDFTYGALSFVLDCSPSMITPLEGKSRFQHAIEALDEVLETIPEKTYLSLIIFIDRGDGKGTVFEPICKPGEWFDAIRPGLIADLKRLDPKKFSGFSPIADALVQSLGQGFPDPSYKGPKLVVALTDGDDNFSFGRRAMPNNKAEQEQHNAVVKTNLAKAFRDSGTEIHIVCFNKEDDPESKNAKMQFEDTVERVDPKGSFTIQPEPGKLAEVLNLAIRPKLRLKKDGKWVAKFKDEGRPINSYNNGELETQPLEAGEYTAILRNRSQKFRLEKGDRSIFSLRRDNNDLFFVRSLFAKEQSDKVIQSEFKSPIQVSVMRNEIAKKQKGLQQLIALENTNTKKILEQQAPGFVWVEIQPKSATAPGLMSWSRDYSYPAPAISVRVNNWPVQEGAKEVPVDTSLWWQWDKYPLNPDFSVSLNRDPGKKIKDDFVRTNLLGKNFIEDVAVEDREIVMEDGKKSLKTCLVVRCRHEPKKPVCVLFEPEEKTAFGEEHCYYSQANKYTALFWNIPEPNNARFTLHMIAMPAFKAACEDAGRSVTLALPSPTTKTGPAPMLLSGSP